MTPSEQDPNQLQPGILQRVPRVIPDAAAGSVQPQPQAPVAKPMAQESTQPLPPAPKPILARANTEAVPESENVRNLRETQERGPTIPHIHNGFLRTLATVGDVLAGTFAPRAEQLIPGTEGNYQLRLARAGNAVKGEQEGALQRANVEHLGAETNTLIPAQARHADAEAQNIKSETPHTLQTADGIMQWNPETKRFDIPAGQAPAKEETEGRTITTDQGIMQWDPKSKSYSIKAGNAPEKEGAAEKTLQDADGVWYHIGKDNAATPITVNGKPFQGKTPGEGKIPLEEQVVNEHIAKVHPNDTLAQARAHTQPPPQTDRGQNFVDPTSGKLVRVEPGGAIPSGAVTASGFGQANAKEASGVKSAEEAVKYGQTYLASGKFTGPKDEALLESFFEVAKPSSGFRMTEQQINLLTSARSWMESAKGIAYHAETGTWFTPTQRQEIVDAMAARAESKGAKVQSGGTGGFKAGDTQVKNGVTYVRDDKGAWHPK